MPEKKSVKKFLEEEEGVDFESFRREVDRVDDKINATRYREDNFDSEDGVLKGLPVSVKDNVCVKGMPATAGSRILESYRPEFTATVVRRLQENGGNVFAKTNMDEFGFGTFSTNSAYEVPRNPHDTDRVTGGSSGGAAALTAALDSPHVAIGQSTGGSISNPAAFCGAVGLTPTYGRVSRYGLIDYANSLDKLGPIADTVEDAAMVLDMISGKDERDFTTVERDYESLSEVEGDVSGMRIGVPSQYMEFEGMDRKVRKKVWRSIKMLEDMGAEVEEVDMPRISKDYVMPSYYITAISEASTNLARFCGMRYGLEGEPERKGFNQYFSEIRSQGFGKEAKRRVLLGHFARQAGYREAYYLKALKVRRMIIEEYKKAFREYDVLASPTMPMIAPRFDEAEELEPVEVYAMDTLTAGPNLAGLPQLSVPCGKVKGMPVGMHLLGGHFHERDIVAAGKAFENKFKGIRRPEL